MQDILEADARRAYYGVSETNPIETAAVTHENVDYDEYVTLGDDRLAKIDRLRLLTEPGYPFYDISYVYGTLKDGTHVRISGVPTRIARYTPKRDLINWAKTEGVFAKGLGLLDESNWSVLR